MKQKILSVLLIIMLLTSVTFSIFAYSQADLDAIQAQIDEKKAEKEEVGTELDGTLAEIEALDVLINQSQAELTSLQEQITNLETSIAQKEAELIQKQQEYDESYKLLQERLVVMYERGDISYLEILLNSTSMIDFLNNYNSLSQLVECDKELLETIEKQQKEIEQSKTDLENQKVEVETAKAKEEQKSVELQQQRTDRESKAASLNAEEQAIQAEIDQYQANMESINKAIEEAIRKAEEERKKQEAASNGGSSSRPSTGANYDGSFIVPCDCRIVTSTVKKRWGRWHKGLDIGARYEPVYASAPGYAYNATNPGGYGTYIIIIHNNGYITLYAHLDSSHIYDGQWVEQGETIATSGNSGGSTGPHLHFEIRKASSFSDFFNSDFLDPLDFLPDVFTFAAGATDAS